MKTVNGPTCIPRSKEIQRSEIRTAFNDYISRGGKINYIPYGISSEIISVPISTKMKLNCK